MLPVDPAHHLPHRDDGHTDFAALLATGHVRDKGGKVIDVHKPHYEWSAHQRDVLYQGYCTLVKSGASAESVRTWLVARCAELKMSEDRARDIINEGNGQWPNDNMTWWRGVSVGSARPAP